MIRSSQLCLKYRAYCTYSDPAPALCLPSLLAVKSCQGPMWLPNPQPYEGGKTIRVVKQSSCIDLYSHRCSHTKDCLLMKRCWQGVNCLGQCCVTKQTYPPLWAPQFCCWHEAHLPSPREGSFSLLCIQQSSYSVWLCRQFEQTIYIGHSARLSLERVSSETPDT